MFRSAFLSALCLAIISAPAASIRLDNNQIDAESFAQLAKGDANAAQKHVTFADGDALEDFTPKVSVILGFTIRDVAGFTIYDFIINCSLFV